MSMSSGTLDAVKTVSWMLMLKDWELGKSFAVLWGLMETTSKGATVAARAMAFAGPPCSELSGSAFGGEKDRCGEQQPGLMGVEEASSIGS